MTKHYCDGCNKELTDNAVCKGGTVVPSRLGTSLEARSSGICVEVMVGKDGTRNVGDWCKYCVIDALMALDDRPRAAK